MSDRADLARGWIQKADSDLFNVRLITGSSGPYDTGCFHAQQSIGKCLKAFLAFHGQAIPRTHDLEVLERLCTAIEPFSELAALDLATLSDYAVQLRYDFTVWPSYTDIQNALQTAEIVRAAVLVRLPVSAHP